MRSLDGNAVDDLDRKIIHALQIAPRATWTALASTLSVDPATLSRRWRRITEAGIARVTANASASLIREGVLSHVLLSCSLKDAAGLADALSEDLNVMSIHLSSGSFPIILNVAARDLDDLTRYLTERLGQFSQVTALRTHIQTALLLDGSSWELRALSAEQRSKVVAMRPVPSGGPSGVPSGVDAMIFERLMGNGRETNAELARALGLSIDTIRRRIDALILSQSITLRCDVAQQAIGLPVGAYLDARYAGDVEPVVTLLRQEVAEIRIMTMSASSHALHFHLWLPSVTDLPRVERQIIEVLPGLVFGARSIVLRTVKQVGYVRDATGRNLRVVPIRV